MRKFINKYGTAIAAVCLVLAIVSYFMTRRSTPGIHINQVFYIDEETGAESVHPATDIPPLVNSHGNPSLVQVMKFSYDGGKTSFVAYYRKYDPESKAKIEELENVPDAQAAQDPARCQEILDYLAKGELIRLPAPGSLWVAAASPEGDQIRQDAMSKNGKSATQVFPP